MGVEPIYVHRPNNDQTVTGLQSTDNIKLGSAVLNSVCLKNEWMMKETFPLAGRANSGRGDSLDGFILIASKKTIGGPIERKDTTFICE
jgi:hypothetical protein